LEDKLSKLNEKLVDKCFKKIGWMCFGSQAADDLAEALLELANKVEKKVRKELKK